MQTVKQDLPNTLFHFKWEIFDVVVWSLDYLVVDFVLAINRYFNLDGEILNSKCLKVAFNQPKTWCHTINSRININVADSQYNSICSIFEWKVFDVKAVNSVEMNLVYFEVVHL